MIGTGALVKGTGAVLIGTGAESIRGPRKGKRAGKRIMVGSPRIQIIHVPLYIFVKDLRHVRVHAHHLNVFCFKVAITQGQHIVS